jgi:hypothetical protein
MPNLPARFFLGRQGAGTLLQDVKDFHHYGFGGLGGLGRGRVNRFTADDGNFFSFRKHAPPMLGIYFSGDDGAVDVDTRAASACRCRGLCLVKIGSAFEIKSWNRSSKLISNRGRMDTEQNGQRMRRYTEWLKRLIRETSASSILTCEHTSIMCGISCCYRKWLDVSKMMRKCGCSR